MKKRIFIGLTEIAGWGHSLENGFRLQGHKANFFSVNDHVFKYSLDSKTNIFIKFIKKYRKFEFSKLRSDGWIYKMFRIVEDVFMFFFLLYTIYSYDVFIFIFHQTFLRDQKDLAILKFFKKQIIILECGSDARPPYINNFVLSDYNNQEIVSWTKGRKKKIKRIEKYADYIISHPPIAIFHEKPFLQFLYIGIAKFYGGLKNDSNFKKSSKVTKILHAPSAPLAKGTYQIRKIIEKLKAEGNEIEYIELQGMPNTTVLRELRSCDFVVDQLASDTPMAGFVMEAALFGKPAVVGGSYASYIEQEIAKKYIPPVEFVLPERVEDSIRKLIVDQSYREKLGKISYDFVHNQWELKTVIRRFECIINDDIPPKWYFSPYDIKYIYGIGFPQEKIRERIREIISTYGIEALQIADKPKLEKMYLEYVGLKEEYITCMNEKSEGDE